MAGLHYKEKERLGLSIFLALVIHGLLFFLIQYVVRLEIPEIKEYSGSVFVELEESLVASEWEAPEELPPPPEIPEEEVPPPEVITEPEELLPESENGEVLVDPSTPTPVRTPVPTPKVTPKATPKPTPTQRTTPRPTPRTTPRITPTPTGTPVAQATPYITTAPKPVVTATPKPVATPTPTPKEASAFSDNILNQLDTALNTTSTATPQKTGSPGSTVKPSDSTSVTTSDSGNGGGTSPLISWDVDAPPRGVTSPKDMRLDISGIDFSGVDSPELRITFSFKVLPQGFMSDISIFQGTGYTNIDNAAKNAFSKWKFNPITGTGVASGKITFIMKITK